MKLENTGAAAAGAAKSGTETPTTAAERFALDEFEELQEERINIFNASVENVRNLTKEIHELL